MKHSNIKNTEYHRPLSFRETVKMNIPMLAITFGLFVALVVAFIKALS